jgi:hypothetical protein
MDCHFHDCEGPKVEDVAQGKHSNRMLSLDSQKKQSDSPSGISIATWNIQPQKERFADLVRNAGRHHFRHELDGAYRYKNLDFEENRDEHYADVGQALWQIARDQKSVGAIADFIGLQEYGNPRSPNTDNAEKFDQLKAEKTPVNVR